MNKRTFSLLLAALLLITMLAGCGSKTEITTGDVGVV